MKNLGTNSKLSISKTIITNLNSSESYIIGTGSFMTQNVIGTGSFMTQNVIGTGSFMTQ